MFKFINDVPRAMQIENRKEYIKETILRIYVSLNLVGRETHINEIIRLIEFTRVFGKDQPK